MKRMSYEIIEKQPHCSVNTYFDGGMAENEEVYKGFAKEMRAFERKVKRLLSKAEMLYDADTGEEVVADEELSGCAGNFTSSLYVEKEEVKYKVELVCVGATGEISITFGKATREMIKKAAALVRKFEEELVTLTYIVKHSYIDNNNLGVM